MKYTYPFLPVLTDSYHTSSAGDVQEEPDPVWQPLECSSLDEDQQKHDWEGLSDWTAWGAVLQDLGHVFCKVRLVFSKAG